MSIDLAQELSRRLAPLRREPGPTRPGIGRRRAIELVLLVAVGIVLAVGTVADLVRRVGVDDRLTADVLTWRAYTGHDFASITTEDGEEVEQGTRDVLCGNTSEGPAGSRIQICLIMTGPETNNERRAVHGGFYLTPLRPDRAPNRYGCFGTAIAENLCGD